MRHTANTRMLENPAVPYNIIEHYMGHQVNSQTKRLYDHLRDVAIQRGADALSSGHVEKIQPVTLAYVRPKPVEKAVSAVVQKRSEFGSR